MTPDEPREDPGEEARFRRLLGGGPPRHAPPLPPRPGHPDPFPPRASAVLSQHARSLMWGEARPEAVPAALPRVMEQTGLGLSRVFQGDDGFPLLHTHPGRGGPRPAVPAARGGGNAPAEAGARKERWLPAAPDPDRGLVDLR